MFSEYGKIKKCRLVRDIVTGRSKKYAFIEFEHSLSAVDASEFAHNKIIDKEKVLVDMECERYIAIIYISKK